MARSFKSVFLMLMVCLCFISIPAFSGEHPWESEGGGNGTNDGDESDTTLVNESQLMESLSAVSGLDSSQFGFSTYLSSRITVWVYKLYSPSNLKQDKVNKGVRFSYRTAKVNY